MERREAVQDFVKMPRNAKGASTRDQCLPNFDPNQRPPTPRSTLKRRRTMMRSSHSPDTKGQTPTPVKDDNFATEKSGSHQWPTPPRPISKRELHSRVQWVYNEGARSPQLFQAVREGSSYISMRVVRISARYIHHLWEGQPGGEEESFGETNRKVMNLSNFMASCFYGIGPKSITFLVAIYYVARLRRLHPTTRGESGCCHRLFSVALLIAMRYHEYYNIGMDSNQFYHQWSIRVSGCFTPQELLWMEMELVSFLKYRLYISFSDFEYFIDRVYNEDAGQVVPSNLLSTIDGCFSKMLDQEHNVDGQVPLFFNPNHAHQ